MPETSGDNMFHVILSSKHLAYIVAWSLVIAEDCQQPEHVVEGLKALSGEKDWGAKPLNEHRQMKEEMELCL